MANNTLSDFPALTNLDAASVTHVQKELVDYQVTLPVLTEYVTANAEYATLGNKIDGADEKTDPADADMVGLMDSAASNALTKFSWANFKAKLKTYFDALYPSVNGWVGLGLTMTYASADSPTFTATVPGDVTGVLSAGMKLKLTQTTVKYFIITAAPSYSSGTGLTTLTLYGGTDYTLVDAAISNVYYSAMKAPHGFPLDPAKWTATTISSTQQTTTSTTYDNAGSISLSVPIGAWELSFKSATLNSAVGAYSTLSTSSNSESDSDFTAYSAAGAMGIRQLTKKICVTSKTPYYALLKSESGVNTAYFKNGDIPMVIRAVCAYL